jgi:hypothetical protein
MAGVRDASRPANGRRPRIGRVDVPAEDHDGDADGAGPLERHGDRLGTATGDPRVVDDEHALSRDATINPGPARIDLPAAGQRLRAGR